MASRPSEVWEGVPNFSFLTSPNLSRGFGAPGPIPAGLPLLVDGSGSIVDMAQPADIFLFQRAPLATLPFSGPAPYGTFSGEIESIVGPAESGVFLNNVWLSFNVDYQTGVISEGRLSLSRADAGAPNGTVIDLSFSGVLPAQSNSALPQGFASLTIDEVFSSAPVDF